MAIDLGKREPTNCIVGPHGEIVTSGPRGQFKLLMDDADLPFIAFAGPVADGIGQVTVELPKEFMENDAMFLFVKFSGMTSESVTIGPGWTLMQSSVEAASAKYLSVFRRMAWNTETAPTITHCDPAQPILAQVVVCRAQERGELKE